MIFKDYKRIPKWAINTMSSLYAKRLIFGDENGNLFPKWFTKRDIEIYVRTLVVMDRGLAYQDTKVERRIEECKPAVVMITTPYGTGSGVIVGKNLVLTNHHVIAKTEDNKITDEVSESIKIKVITDSHNFEQTKTFNGRVLANDMWDDLAAVFIEDCNIDVKPIRISEVPATEGEFVIAIGNPGKVQFITSFGIIGNDMSFVGLRGMVHTDAQISGGSSGGGIFAIDDGRYLGPPTMKYEQLSGRIMEGLGFAVPLISILNFLINSKLQYYFNYNLLELKERVLKNGQD